MRRYAILVGASMVGLYAGCSSDPLDNPVNEGAEQDAGALPGDARAEPGDDEGVEKRDAAPPIVDAGPDVVEVRPEGWDPDFMLPGVAGPLGPSIASMAHLVDRQIVAGGISSSRETPMPSASRSGTERSGLRLEVDSRPMS